MISDNELTEDFTEEIIKELKTLSKEELIKLRNRLLIASSSNNTAQENRKILLNSLYGSIGNVWSRFYDLRNATAITTYGQLAIRWVSRSIDEELNKLFKTDSVEYVAYIDTDSCYLDVSDFVDKVKERVEFKTDNDLVDFLDKFAEEKIQTIINNSITELYEYMNNFSKKLSMDREVISMPSLNSDGLGGFWTAKKRYALNVYDSEGTRFAKPKLKILGLETQRSSTPEVLREVLGESIRIMLQEGEEALHKQVEQFKEEYDTFHYTEVAGVITANNLEKYEMGDSYISGTPGHVRGALLYNRLLRERGITSATPIMSGSKVMEIALIDQNPWQTKTICWPSGLELPIEIEDEIISYMDYNEQYDKTFIKPISAMCEASGIKHEQINDLSDFFNF